MAIAMATVRETKAERILTIARFMGEQDSESRLRDIDLRRAHEIDPANPLIMWDRAIFLLNEQKKHFLEQQYNLMSEKTLLEAIALLDEAEASYHFPPSLHRMQGDASSMLAEVYRRTDREEEAKRWRQYAFDKLFEAARKLPRPRDRRESFNASLVMASQNMRRQDLATEFLMRMFRFDERYVLYERDMLRNASQGYFGLGLLPLQMREIHMGLARNPDDAVLAGSLRMAAGEFGQRVAVLAILEDLERRDLLRPQTNALLQQLRTEDAANGEEAQDHENQ